MMRTLPPVALMTSTFNPAGTGMFGCVLLLYSPRCGDVVDVCGRARRRDLATEPLLKATETVPSKAPRDGTRGDPQPSTLPRSLRDRVSSAGKSAGANARKASEALVVAVGRLAGKAIDRVLLTEERVTSAAEGKRLLTGEADTEALAGDIQRVVVLAVPVVRTLARGARFTRVPWVMVASSAVSIGVGVRTGVRELQVLASLVAHRLEQATGTPSDPALVKKLAIDLYLDPKHTPKLADGRLRLVRLTRKWVLSGAFGRKTSKRAARALAAAERLDAAALSARWGAANHDGSHSVGGGEDGSANAPTAARSARKRA
jgi:hypothetical protein